MFINMRNACSDVDECFSDVVKLSIVMSTDAHFVYPFNTPKWREKIYSNVSCLRKERQRRKSDAVTTRLFRRSRQ